MTQSLSNVFKAFGLALPEDSKGFVVKYTEVSPPILVHVHPEHVVAVLDGIR
jgi:hypothetical protein